MNIGLLIKRRSHTKSQFEERNQYWLVLKFRLCVTWFLLVYMYAKSSTFQHELLVHKQASYYNLYKFTLMKSHSSIVSGFNCRLYRKQGVKICEYLKQCQWFVFTGWSTDRGTDCWWVNIMCCSTFLIFSPWWFGVHSGVEADDDRILSHDAPRFMLYYHCVRDTSWSVIFSTREVNIDRSARCGWFPNMFRFSSFCFWDYRVG